MVDHFYNPSTRSLKQEDCYEFGPHSKFQVSLNKGVGQYGKIKDIKDIN